MDAAMPKDAPVNTGAGSDTAPMGSYRRVSEMQGKLHRWAATGDGRRFDDLFNLVHDPATLMVAFDRVAGNHGANTPGVDKMTVGLARRRSGSSSSWMTCGPSCGRTPSGHCRCVNVSSRSRVGRARSANSAFP
jgi:hypothetical protein